MSLTISVVIPLYNGERFVREALASVFAQTLPPTEIIVVDDGSTDNGAVIVTGMADKHPIRLLSKPNGGQSAARNFGVMHATGDLIALLDQDDIWYPRHLEELVKPFAVTGYRKIGWVYSEVDEIDLDGNMVTQDYLRTQSALHPKRDIFECLRRNMYVVPSATLILREAFDAVGGFDERLAGYEDDDLFLRLFRAGYGDKFLDTALVQWRLHTESSSFTPRMRESQMIFFRKWWDTFPDEPQRRRSIKRDLLAPRFYPIAMDEYGKALQGSDAALIDQTREQLLLILNQMPGLKRKVFSVCITGMRSPRLMALVLSLRPYLRPFVRLFV